MIAVDLIDDRGLRAAETNKKGPTVAQRTGKLRLLVVKMAKELNGGKCQINCAMCNRIVSICHALYIKLGVLSLRFLIKETYSEPSPA